MKCYNSCLPASCHTTYACVSYLGDTIFADDEEPLPPREPSPPPTVEATPPPKTDSGAAAFECRTDKWKHHTG